MPIYIDENHYQKNKTTILNSFSVIKFGAQGLKEYDFNPDQIFEILPILLNKMIIGMFNGKSSICSSFIRCYFQYVLLFKKLCLEYEKEYLKYVNHLLNVIKQNDYNADKSIIPDIGNFFMLLFFSNRDTNNQKMKKMWNILFEEFAIRQAYWIFHEYNNKTVIENLIRKNFCDGIVFKHFEEDNSFDMDKNGKFFEDLEKNKLLDELVDIIMNDPYFINLKDPMLQNEDQVTQALKKSFKKIFSLCNKKTKESIKEFLFGKIKFADYFKLNPEFFEKNNYGPIDLYESLKIDLILKNLDKDTLQKVLDYAFESQRGNKLLIITFFTKKKIEDKEFMEELQKNYGIYLEVDTFIKEMNQKLKEIKNYHDFFNYIGSDFGKDMNDLDILTHCYKKAIEKNYIRKQNLGQSFGRSQEFFRGRGGFGRGRGEFGRGRGGFGRGRGSEF